MKSRNKAMLDKSVAAIISAIEIYNKPDFKYREETFSVLCINSWELLLKAKVLQLSANKLTSLFVWEKKKLRDGSYSAKRYRKLNRAGNPMSVSLYEALRIITDDYGVLIDRAVRDNIEALTEIRDNSIHFINDDYLLSTKIQEIGTASLQNYLHLVKDWFGDVLSRYNFYLMPLSFFRDFDTAPGISLNTNEKKLLKYITSIEEAYDDADYGNYNLALRIDVKFQKAKSTTGVPVQITNNPDAPAFRLSEENLMEKYPWDYKILITRLNKRYSDFKVNHQFHEQRKSFFDNEKLCHSRLFNPANEKSGTKIFYSTNILKEFDKLYTKKLTN